MLKEVKGVVAAQVETPPQALITVENLFTAAGKTFLGKDGESLKLLEASRQVGGDVQVQLELIDSSSANAQWVMRRGIMRPRRPGFGMGRRGGLIEDNTPPPNLLLQDAEGHNFPLRNRDRDDVGIRGNGLVREITLTYCGGLGLGEPKKLVYSGRRTIIVEIPFTLKDVPLR